jgi:hypothetical protein
MMSNGKNYQIKMLSSLSIAAMAGLGMQGSAVRAATLNSYYNNAVISTVLPAQEVLGVNATLVSLNQSSPTITVPLGDYVSYGVSAVVINNVNPNGGTLYGNGLGNPSSIVDPTNLGLADLGYRVVNIAPNNAAGQLLQPVLNGLLGTIANVVQYNSTAVFGGIGKPGLSTPKSNYSFEEEAPGDVEANFGRVGSTFQIFGGNAGPDPTTATGYAELSYFAASSPSSSNAVNVFDSLAYQTQAVGMTTVQPAIDTTATQYWTESAPGAVSSPAKYSANFFSSGDTINPLPALTINIEPTNVPEPASLGLLAASGVALLGRRKR